jgi:hypothetical protein
MDKKEIQKKVFAKQISKKLLGTGVVSQPHLYTLVEAMKDPQKQIENSIIQFQNTKEAQSDVVPYIESNFLEVLVPSLFGAKPHFVNGVSVDVKPIFRDIYETKNIGEIDIFGGEMENAIKHLEFIKKNAPDDFYVSPTRQLSPLDCAVVLFGGEFYTELYAEPEIAIAFMNKIADVTIKVIKELKAVIGQPLDECITPRGFVFNGFRLTGDSVVNLSPTMIEDIMCPIYKRFEQEFGSVMLHYCCTPAPSTHVAAALVKGGGVSWVDNWQGYKTLLKEEDYLKNNIGVCTDIDKNIILTGEIANIPFYNTDRPLVANTACTTVEEAKKVYEIWQETMNK